MSHLKKGIIGSLQDAYEALLDGQIICNPKHSPYTDPKYKYCKMQLIDNNEFVHAYGVGRLMKTEQFKSLYEDCCWNDGWELYYNDMHLDTVITITTDNNNTEAYRVSNEMLIAIKTMLNNQK